ncbi:type II secretion system F family protein [Arthrobacter sp. NEB 688]|uniref:type II secretion system F family protein n=1 Tax=Arthrobacter sp. NEB 688 TaxID=904039 RepID=UPI00156425C0|nr:type II secretion system F family protein [Arthrobacter sp. NEB 688]QKE85407.1 type II secretion system F family protein [Arthrobacter sp. NEB 688]
MSWLVGAVPGVVAAVAAYLFLRGYRMLRTDPASDLAVEDIAILQGATQKRARSQGPVSAVAYRLAPRVRRLLPSSAIALVRRQVDQAGRPEGIDVDSVIARGVLWMLIVSPAVVIFVLQGRLLPVLMALAAIVVMPLARLSAMGRKRRERIDRDLPDFLDVLAVTVSAGIGFRQALGVVSERFGGPLSEEVMTTLHQITNGASVRSAFRAMRDRNTSESIEEFTTAYLQAEELGAPLVDTLNQIATDMRRASAQRSRQKAAAIAPRVTLLTTVVMVPGAMILLIVGLYIGSDLDLGSFGGL